MLQTQAGKNLKVGTLRGRVWHGEIKITREPSGAQGQRQNYIAFDTDLPGFGVRDAKRQAFFLMQYRRHEPDTAGDDRTIGIVTAELARREATPNSAAYEGGWRSSALTRTDGHSDGELGQRFLAYVPFKRKP
jgi:hypothetical protein